MTTAAYVRISHDSQKNGVSVDRQWEMILSYCARQSLPAPTRFADVDWSGTTSRRPRWSDLLRDLRARRVTCVVAYDQDRLFRDEEEAAAFIKLVKRVKCAVHFVTSGRLDLTSADAHTMFSFKAVVDAAYSRKISEKVSAWARHKRERGEKTGGLVPFGWDVAEGVLVPNPKEQEVVERMLHLRDQGSSYIAIAHLLMRDGVPTKRGLRWWGHKQVARIVARSRKSG